MKTRDALAQVACFSAVLVACASDPSTPTAAMQIYETCVQTQCDAQTATNNSACSACTNACLNASYDCDPSTACTSSCAPTSCDGSEQSQCIEYGYEVTLPNNPSPDIDAACNRELAQIASCGYTTQTMPTDCDRYAATEIPSLASSYDCVAQLPCSSLTDTNALAACGPPTSTIGDAFCASFASACSAYSCSTADQAALDVDGAWVRSDALDALNTCLAQPTCDDTVSCIAAWRLAVE
jgi:hypothetical protein